MVKFIKTLRWIVIVTILLFGGCVHYLWTDYQGASPCNRRGASLGFTSVVQHYPAGSNYPAVCGGFNGGSYVSFRAR